MSNSKIDTNIGLYSQIQIRENQDGGTYEWGAKEYGEKAPKEWYELSKADYLTLSSQTPSTPKKTLKEIT